MLLISLPKIDLSAELQKAKLSDILGYGDEVRGFDSFVADDSIDHLEIYAEFLGKQEYGRAKQNYERAL